jgi:hypothetical protein
MQIVHLVVFQNSLIKKSRKFWGLVIAVVTLTLPPFIIARYSGGSLEEMSSTTYPIGRISE